MNMNRLVPLPTSITHQHIVATINTLIAERSFSADAGTIRILDMGCGDGKLISHILDALPLLQPRYKIECYGLDVADAGVQVSGFMNRTIDDLSGKYPDIDWRQRLALISHVDHWPCREGHFDFITSNQVMEHVRDHQFVFSEISRCLAPGGVNINLFPVREVLFEGHALMPLVHKISDTDRRARFMKLFAKAGFNRCFRRDGERHGWTTIDEFARKFSRILEEDTNYVSGRQLLQMAGRAGLDGSFLYTKDFYRAKLWSLIGKRSYCYRNWRIGEQIAFNALRYVSSITFVMRKGTECDSPVRAPAALRARR